MANAKILEAKQKVIDEIKERVENAKSVVLFDYRGIDIKESLVGPSAFAYGEDQVGTVKILTNFAKEHPSLVLKVGIVDGEIADQAKLAEYATIPSREGLLTMLAGGMMGIPRDLSICLDLYSAQKEEN
mgnify:CR=1 FL=1